MTTKAERRIVRAADRELAEAATIAREWLPRLAYARKYGVGLRTVEKWLEAGILEIYRVDRVLRIRDIKPDLHRPPEEQRTRKASSSATSASA